MSCAGRAAGLGGLPANRCSRTVARRSAKSSPRSDEAGRALAARDPPVSSEPVSDLHAKEGDAADEDDRNEGGNEAALDDGDAGSVLGKAQE